MSPVSGPRFDSAAWRGRLSMRSNKEAIVSILYGTSHARSLLILSRA